MMPLYDDVIFLNFFFTKIVHLQLKKTRVLFTNLNSATFKLMRFILLFFYLKE